MRRALYILAATVLAATGGCTRQRDLFTPLPSTLSVVSPWTAPLGEYYATDATMLFYGEAEGKEFYSQPDMVSTSLLPGKYTVLVFNGVMESEQVTNLDYVFLRGTNALSTFEACVAESSARLRLRGDTDEYMAVNNMSLFAFGRGEVEIDEHGGYVMVYDNGERVAHDGNATAQHISVDIFPRAYSYRFRVRLTGLVNPQSAVQAVVQVRGLAGSVFPVTDDDMPRMGLPVTHQLALSTPSSISKLRTGDDGVETGTIETPWFVTFGPRVLAAGEMPESGLYFIDPVFVLRDGTTFTLPEPVDITARVNEIAATIWAHHSGGKEIVYADNYFEIEVADLITLPVVDGNGELPGEPIGVDDWGEDIPMVVWI